MSKVHELEEKLKAVSGREKVDLLNELASLLVISDLKKSESYLAEAFRLSNEAKYIGGKAKGYIIQGQIYTVKGPLDQAEKYFHEALSLYKELDDEKGISNATVNLGRVFWDRGDYSRALEYFLKSIEISEKIQDDKGIASGHSHVALFYWNRKEHDEAIKHLGKTLEYQERTGERQDIALTYNRFGAVYKEKGEIDRALDNYKRAIRIMEENGNSHNIDAAMIYNNMGAAYDDDNQPDKALIYYNKALQMAEAIGYKETIIFALANLGNIKFKSGQHDEAKNDLKKALQICRETGFKELEMACLEIITKIYKSTKDHEQALIYHEQYTGIKEQISDEQRNKQVAEMQVRFESEKSKKEAEIYRLKNVELKKYQEDLEELIKDRTRELSDALREVEELKNHFQAENIYLREEIKLDHNFNEIVGRSENLKKVLAKVELVASTGSTVLILGETGTGKELIARAIHGIGPRKNRPLVKVDCATLPSNLMESELFGHEKGAFTGAFMRKIGRFELADKGTILLDEIGELPLELQAKLLRVLQDNEFERIGGSKSIKIDVQVIAITNRDIEKAVNEGKFRDDLYYRLNVFPLKVPPLRGRKDDIPILVNHFILKYGRKTGKKIDKISQDAMNALINYDWPGNIRELENVIERSLILSRNGQFELCDWVRPNLPTSILEDAPTLMELEKEYIQKVLRRTNWRIHGEKGAARILGLKGTTLDARIKKLCIHRPR